jgi:PAS domain S-box-containing protein
MEEFPNHPKDGERSILPKMPKESVEELRQEIIQLRQQVAELREKQAHQQVLEELWEGWSSPLVLCRADGTMMAANPMFERMLGEQAQRLPGEKLWKWLSRTAKLSNDQRERLLAWDGAKPWLGCPFLVVGNNGAEFLFKINEVVGSSDNIASYFLLIGEEASGNGFQLLSGQPSEDVRTILDNTPSSVYMKDKAGKYLFVNRQFERSMNRERGQLIGKSDHELFLPEIADVFAANDQKVIEIGSPLECEEVTTENGEERTFLSLKFPVRNEQGVVVGVCGISTDMTEKKRAQAALQHSEAKHRQLIEQLPALISVLKAGHLVFANPAVVSGLGFNTPEEILGKHVSELVIADQREQINRVIEQVEITGEPPEVREWNFVRKDGSIAVSEIRALRYEFEGETAVLAVAHDLTKRKRLEEQLRLSQRLDAVGRLAGAVAHDFNNMLIVILNTASTMRSGSLTVAASRNLAERIEEVAHRATELTRRLMLFSQRESHPAEQMNVIEVVSALEPLIQGTLTRSVQLRTMYLGQVAPVRMSRAALEQVVMNLVLNAKDAIQNQGEIAISVQIVPGKSETESNPTTETHDWVELKVVDSGCGMPEEVRKRALEPFFTTKDREHGTGLGLSIVQGIVKSAGGRLFIESVPDCGTTLRIILPVDENYYQRNSYPHSSRPSVEAKDAVILVVEDEANVREVIGEMLTEGGYRVFSACHGEEAVQIAKGLPHLDLLLTDVIMPKLSGPQVAEAISQIWPDLRVIFMSGYAGEELQAQRLNQNKVFVLEKPFGIGMLHDVVRKALS